MYSILESTLHNLSILGLRLQKMGQQQGHKAVLEEDAVLNDAPLRARLKHVAARHGVVVHSGAVKACSLAVDLYLRRVLQDTIRMHELRTGQAKDVPGMVRDLSRNWARDVRQLPRRLLGGDFLSMMSMQAGVVVSCRWLSLPRQRRKRRLGHVMPSSYRKTSRLLPIMPAGV